MNIKSFTQSIFLAMLGGPLLAMTPLSFGAETALLEEIVVTARKTAESAQDVPIFITVASGEELAEAQIFDIGDLDLLAPNLEIPILGGTPYFQSSMRGQYTRDADATQDGSVGLYLDGVTVTRNRSFEFFDIERVEVLKGPQGTLYGRNTTGGAISVVTKAPNLSEVEGNVSTTVGNYDLRTLTGVVSVPIIEDELGIRLAARFADRDATGENQALAGLNTNPTEGEFGVIDSESFRLSTLWDSDKTTVRFTADYYSVDNTATAMRLTSVNAFDPGTLNSGNPPRTTPTGLPVAAALAEGLLDADGNPDVVAAAQMLRDRFINGSLGWQNTSLDLDPTGNALDPNLTTNGLDARYWGTNLTIEHEFENVTFRSISGYREDRYTHGFDIDGTSYFLGSNVSHRDQEVVTQEFNLFGEAFDEKLDWLVGAYYIDEEVQVQDVTRLSGPVFLRNSQLAPLVFAIPVFPNGQGNVATVQFVGNSAEAIFAQATYSFDDNWSTTFGLRYTQDERSVSVEDRATNEVTEVLPGVPLPSNLVNPDYTKGPVAGSPVTTLPTLEFTNVSGTLGIEYQSDDGILYYAKTSTGYRAGGYNSRQLPNPQSFNEENVQDVEVGVKGMFFDNRLQTNFATFLSDYTDIQTVSRIEVNGFPQTVTLNAGEATIKGMELEVNLALSEQFTLNSNIGYIDAEFDKFDEVRDPSKPEEIFDRSHEPFANTPEITYNVQLIYSQDIEAGTLGASLNYNYRHEMYSDRGVFDLIEDRKLIDARVSFTSADDRYSVALWSANLTDEEYIDRQAASPVSFGNAWGSVGPPRTFGVDLNYRF